MWMRHYFLTILLSSTVHITKIVTLLVNLCEAWSCDCKNRTFRQAIIGLFACMPLEQMLYVYIVAEKTEIWCLTSFHIASIIVWCVNVPKLLAVIQHFWWVARFAGWSTQRPTLDCDRHQGIQPCVKKLRKKRNELHVNVNYYLTASEGLDLKNGSLYKQLRSQRRKSFRRDLNLGDAMIFTFSGK